MVEILRVSASGDSVIYKENGRYYSLDTASNVRSGGMSGITSFTSHGGWRRATRMDKEKFRKYVDSEIEVFSEAPAPRQYRLPSTVRNSISALNFNDLDSILTVTEMNFLLDVIQRGNGLTIDEIADLNSISRKVSERTSILTAAGQSWINKVEQGIPALVASNTTFDDDDAEYFAVSPDPAYPTSVNALYMVDDDSDAVHIWQAGEFKPLEGVTADTFSAPSIIPIDNATAQVFALWLDAQPEPEEFDGGLLYNLEESDPAENNLMKSGEEEIETELGLLSMALVAAKDYFAPTKRTNGTKTLGKNWAKMMVRSYTPAERSANASKQRRNSSGQFSKQSGGQAKLGASKNPHKKGKRTKGKKAKLGASKYKYGTSYRPEAIPKLQKSLEQWAKEYIDKQYESRLKGRGKSSNPGGDQINTAPRKGSEDDKTPNSKLEIDPKNLPKTMPGRVESPEALRKRIEEERKAREEFLKNQEDDAKSLTSAAESEDVDTRYIAMVASDDHEAVTDVVALRRADGDFTTWVRSHGEWTDAPEFKEEILGVTPPPMVELTDEEQIKDVLEQVDSFDSEDPVDVDEPVAASLFSEFGEVYPVSAAADGVRGTERLKRYWTRGKGAAKIRWGTKGDLTRCHRHLSKYLGSQRAWGYCQNRHQDIFGVSNAKRDKAAG